MFMVNTYRWDYPQVAALVAPRPLLICEHRQRRHLPARRRRSHVRASPPHLSPVRRDRERTRAPTWPSTSRAGAAQGHAGAAGPRLPLVQPVPEGGRLARSTSRPSSSSSRSSSRSSRRCRRIRSTRRFTRRSCRSRAAGCAGGSGRVGRHARRLADGARGESRSAGCRSTNRPCWAAFPQRRHRRRSCGPSRRKGSALPHTSSPARSRFNCGCMSCIVRG